MCVVCIWNSLPSPVDYMYSMYTKQKWISCLDTSHVHKSPHYTCENNLKNLENLKFEIFLVPSFLSMGHPVCDYYYSALPRLDCHTWLPFSSLMMRAVTICFTWTWSRWDPVPSRPMVLLPSCLSQGKGWSSFRNVKRASLLSTQPGEQEASWVSISNSVYG